MFTLSSFNKYADSNFLLIIDDFHTIRPRSNGRYNLFMTKLFQKKASVIFVTHETYNMRDLVSNFKQIKIEHFMRNNRQGLDRMVADKLQGQLL